jgi:hypothetical protein
MRTRGFGKFCFVRSAVLWMREAVGVPICVTNCVPEACGVWPPVIGSAGKPTPSQMA